MVIMDPDPAESDLKKLKAFSRVQAVMDIDFKVQHDSRICDILDDVESTVPNVEIYFDSGTYEFNGSFDDIAKVHETLKKHDGQSRHYLVSAASWNDSDQQELIRRRLQNSGMKVDVALQQKFVVLEVRSDDKMVDTVARPEREVFSDAVPWCYLHNVEPILDKSDRTRWNVKNDQADKRDKNDPTVLKRDSRLLVETGRKEEGKHVRRQSVRSKSGHQDGTNDRNVDEKRIGRAAESETGHGYTSDNETSEDGGRCNNAKQQKAHKASSKEEGWEMVEKPDTSPGHAEDVKRSIDPMHNVEKQCDIITTASDDKDLCKLDKRTGDTTDNGPNTSSTDKCLGSCSDHSVDGAAAGTGGGGGAGGLCDDDPGEMDARTNLLSATLSISPTTGNMEANNRYSERVSDEKSFEMSLEEARDTPGLPQVDYIDQPVNNSDQKTSREASEPAGSLEHEPLSHPVSLPRINSDVSELSPDQNEKPPPSIPVPPNVVSSDPAQEDFTNKDFASTTAGNNTSQLAKEIEVKADDAFGKSPPDGVSLPLTPGDQHSNNSDQGSVIQSQAGMDSVVQKVRPGRDQLCKSEVYNKNQESKMF